MLHHYQQELNHILEKAADFFGINNMGIFGQFAIMAGTLSFLSNTQGHNLFLDPEFINHPIFLAIGAIVGLGAKFFTMCVGAIATIKFVKQTIAAIKSKLKNKKTKKNADNSGDNK